MLIRLSLAILAGILSLGVQHTKSSNKRLYKIFIFMLWLVLAVPFVFRDVFFPYSLTGDYENYLNRFQYMSLQRALSSVKDIGFNLLIVLCRNITDDFKLFAFVCISIIIAGIFSFLEDNSEDFSLSITIYVCIMYLSSYNILRQWMACAICMAAFKYVNQHQIKKFVLGVLIASTFHFSALIFLVLYPLINGTGRIREKLLLLAVAGFIVFNYSDNLLSIMRFVSMRFGTSYGEQYLRKEMLMLDTANYTNFVISFCLLVAMTLVLFLQGFNEAEEAIFIYVMICCLFALIGPRNTVFSRLMVYFFPSILLGFPLLEKILKKNTGIPIYRCIIGGLTISAFCFL